ncbi:ArsR/SmtB family transcription factor [Paramicrobacterium fandaimingii]|uniref:ArsR/SmtB family transcription factor n=1 Tax=Paramicrobacterium fandaimingii TaxID=2708079 RepID=UPI001C3F66A0|nr:helix-turn-helix domain-containing protein [Microbacterium fandaimingii]
MARSSPMLDHPDLATVPLTAVFAALGDPTRLTIVQTLLEEPDGLACGAFPVDVAASTLSHHFKVLRLAGLIHQEERGTRRWTTLRQHDLEAWSPGILRIIERPAAPPTSRE